MCFSDKMGTFQVNNLHLPSGAQMLQPFSFGGCGQSQSWKFKQIIYLGFHNSELGAELDSVLYSPASI